MSLPRKIYKKEDFRKGDFILYRYIGEDYIKAEIVELKSKTALIEIAMPTRKNEELETEQFEVSYYDIVPFSTVAVKENHNEKV